MDLEGGSRFLVVSNQLSRNKFGTAVESEAKTRRRCQERTGKETLGRFINDTKESTAKGSTTVVRLEDHPGGSLEKAAREVYLNVDHEVAASLIPPGFNVLKPNSLEEFRLAINAPGDLHALNALVFAAFQKTISDRFRKTEVEAAREHAPTVEVPSM